MKSRYPMSPGFRLAVATGIILMLVAWSPPTGDHIVQTGTQTNTTGFRGFIAGKNNTLTTADANGYAATFGNNNNAAIRGTVVAGSWNELAIGAAAWDETLQSSGIFGNYHVIPKSRSGLVVGGSYNTVNATHSLAVGNANTLNGLPLSSATTCSAAIGQLNQVATTTGWAVGYDNRVNGTRSLALGTGAQTANADSTALGRYNADMASNDVLAIGSGTSNSNRFTALRVTNDGGIILGRAQGDISMGAYGN